MQLPIELKDAIDENAFCAISTHAHNGEVQTHLMWIDYLENKLIINTEIGRKKAQNIRNNKNISLAHCIQMGDVWRLHDACANIPIDTGLNYADAWSQVVSKSWKVWCVDPCHEPPTIFIILTDREACNL